MNDENTWVAREIFLTTLQEESVKGQAVEMYEVHIDKEEKQPNMEKYLKHEDPTECRKKQEQR